jgi:hypothetical protein
LVLKKGEALKVASYLTEKEIESWLDSKYLEFTTAGLGYTESAAVDAFSSYDE